MESIIKKRIRYSQCMIIYSHTYTYIYIIYINIYIIYITYIVHISYTISTFMQCRNMTGVLGKDNSCSAENINIIGCSKCSLIILGVKREK